MIKKYLVLMTGLLAAFCAGTMAQKPLDPRDAVKQMGRGINLGNTLEPPQEGGWNNPPAQEYYFDDYKAAGFTCVRVPVRWDEHTDKKPPYAVDKAWMDRVEQVVDWGLGRDLFVILNAHHDDWLKKGYADPNLRDRFDSIWRQIADRFKNKSEKLLFEILNEPFGMTASQVDEMNARILAIIRKENPTRLVIYSGPEWTGIEHLMNAAVPKDQYLIGGFHSYDPESFALKGQGTWGTDADQAAVKAIFDKAAEWSKKTKIPVLLGEFGAVTKNDPSSRAAFYTAFVRQAVSHGIAFTVWDDGGDFQVYQRKERRWSDIRDILIQTPRQPCPEDAAGLLSVSCGKLQRLRKP